MSEVNPQKKKGLHPLAWVAIGCGALIILGMAAVTVGGFFVFNKAKEVVGELEENPAKVAAEMVVRVNPELEMVESDERAGTMTIRNTRTGESVTLDYEEIAEGRLSIETSEGEQLSVDAQNGEDGVLRVTTEDGETRIGAGSAANIPDWVPLYPGTEPTASFSTSGDQGAGGMLSFETDDSPQEVLDYYAERFESEGYETSHQNAQGAGGQGFVGTLLGKSTATGRTLNVTVIRNDERTVANLNYSEGNP